MTNQKNIEGKISHEKIGMGFWGITDANGEKWQPINIPEQLKIEGATVNCKVNILEDVATTAQWGTPVKIISFETPMP